MAHFIRQTHDLFPAGQLSDDPDLPSLGLGMVWPDMGSCHNLHRGCFRLWKMSLSTTSGYKL